MSNEITVVREGESLPFSFDLDGASLSGYVLTITVKQFAADSTLITARIIAATGTKWTGFLTSTEIDSLANNTTFRLIGTAVHAGDDKEIQFVDDNRFTITPTWG